MGTGQIIVCLRSWPNQDEHRDEYYEIAATFLPELRSLTRRRGGNPTAARDLVKRHGRQLQSQVTVENIEY